MEQMVAWVAATFVFLLVMLLFRSPERLNAADAATEPTSQAPNPSIGIAAIDADVSQRTGPKEDYSDKTLWRAEHVCGANCTYLMVRCYKDDAQYGPIRDAMLSRGSLTSLQDIAEVAGSNGVRLILAKLSPEEMRAAPLPVIAHVDFITPRGESGGHYILVTHLDENNIDYVDGTTAETRSLTWEQFRRRWSGYIAYHPQRTLSSTLSNSLAVLVGVIAGIVCVRIARGQKFQSLLRFGRRLSAIP